MFQKGISKEIPFVILVYMKSIILPILRAIFVVIWTIGWFFVLSPLYFLWEFKFLSYNHLSQNENCFMTNSSVFYREEFDTPWDYIKWKHSRVSKIEY